MQEKNLAFTLSMDEIYAKQLSLTLTVCVGLSNRLDRILVAFRPHDQLINGVFRNSWRGKAADINKIWVLS